MFKLTLSVLRKNITHYNREPRVSLGTKRVTVNPLLLATHKVGELAWNKNSEQNEIFTQLYSLISLLPMEIYLHTTKFS